MELINATKMEAGYTMAVRKDGRELLVVVVKGTFTIPESGEKSALAEEQVPLVETDIFTGEPGFSAPLYENDFAPRKPKCDLLLNGSAYAPDGKPAERVTVSLSFGEWKKSFDVVGNRTWKVGLFGSGPTSPEPFTAMPISYNNAFGGVDRSQEEEKKHKYFLENHVGVGYHAYLDDKLVEGQPLPNTEENGKPVKKPNGTYRPMAFGALGRAWKERVQYAGTYDQNWIDNVCPFLPEDFREEYFQAAPADQWIDYPQGGEKVELENLTAGGMVSFPLPEEDVPFTFWYKNGTKKKRRGTIDTILFEPDQGRFTMTWRTALPLRKSLFEIRYVTAGSQFPKQRFASLGELAAWKREFSSES